MVKNFVSFAIGVMFVLGSQAMAAPANKVQITVEKKKGDGNKGKAGGEGSRAKSTEQVAYSLKLKNISFADLTGLSVEYRIFVERQELGKKKGTETVERVAGTKPVGTLTRQAPQAILTDEVTLHSSNLVGEYIYPDGGRIKAEDSIVGVWVRVSQNGEFIGEYTLPTTVTARGWGGN